MKKAHIIAIVCVSTISISALAVGLTIASIFSKSKRPIYLEGDEVFSVGATNNGVEKYGEDVDFLLSAVPQERHMKYHELDGYYNFIHFGINTFTDREWGTGQEDLSIFNPKKLDTDSWCEALRASGSNGVIITAKHHDGFCLFPSEYTDYDISSTPYKDGKGDILKELSESCQRYDMKMGIYLSPWDMHEPTYGKNEYNVFFKNQLKEVLNKEKYGDIFAVWFDGARGEEANLDYDFSYDFNRNFLLEINGKATKFALNNLYYDEGIEGTYVAAKEPTEATSKAITIKEDGTCMFFGGVFGDNEFSANYSYDENNNTISFTVVPDTTVSKTGIFNESYFGIIRELQPNAVISIIGPDIRWVGNEEGDINENEWCVRGALSLTQEEIEERSQHSSTDTSKLEKGSFEVESRQSLLMSKKLIWSPVESDVKNRGSWFWHKNDKVKSANVLANLYLKNVGGNGNLLLNVPPNKDGLFDSRDVKELKKFGERIAEEFSRPILYSAKIGNCNSKNYKEGLEDLNNPTLSTGFQYGNDDYILDLDFFDGKKNVRNIVISEDITNSQRIEDYSVYLKKPNGAYELVSHKSTIGTKRIITLDSSYDNKCIGIRFVVNQSRNNPVINFVGVYEDYSKLMLNFLNS